MKEFCDNYPCCGTRREEFYGLCGRCWAQLPDKQRELLEKAKNPFLAADPEPRVITYRIPVVNLRRVYLVALAAVLTPEAARAVWHWIGRMM